jgi:glycosyltransferase involved in cell wall biosynthesis
LKIAVCNRYWPTAGGGESYALAIAHALRHLGAVDLIAPPRVPWDDVAGRLQADVSHLGKVEVDFEDAAALRRVSADYDLFVNTSFMTDLVSLAGHSLLVVHFPAPLDESLNRLQSALLRASLRFGVIERTAVVRWDAGFYNVEGRRPSFRWTNGDGLLALHLPSERTYQVELVFGRDRPSPTEVTVVHAGRTLTSTKVSSGVDYPRVSFEVEGQAATPVIVRVVSDTWRPSKVWGSRDERRLGVQVVDARVSGGPVSRFVSHRRFLEPARQLRWLDSYDRILVNSHYTKGWLERWWGRPAETLYPGVAPRRRDAKAPIILGVGRFFAPERGHSKHQLQMVEAMGRLVAGGLRGWELHLVGGCQPDDRPYLHRVRAAARGLPVVIHVDADGPTLADLYARASVFWQATGMLEDARREPEQHEHFGIAVVEAMSAGAVPVVYRVGGPAETVRHGVEGLHFRDLDSMVAATRRLADDDALRERLAAAAQRRAADFSPDALAARLDQIVSSL